MLVILFSLARAAFATLRPNLAYFRLLPPYDDLLVSTLSSNVYSNVSEPRQTVAGTLQIESDGACARREIFCSRDAQRVLRYGVMEYVMLHLMFIYLTPEEGQPAAYAASDL